MYEGVAAGGGGEVRGLEDAGGGGEVMGTLVEDLPFRFLQ